MTIESFDYDQAFTLDGTLITTRGAALHTYLAAQFPVAPGDCERECTLTVLDATTVSVHIRYDGAIREDDLIQQVLTAAPDAQGTLTLQWPYTELQEHTMPVDLRFLPDRVEVFDYLLQPNATPRAIVDRLP